MHKIAMTRHEIEHKLGLGCKVKRFKADTTSRGRSEGRISHEAIKANRKWEGVIRPNQNLSIKLEILLGTKFN